ncbi:MAG: hypothetical protein AAFZ92_04680 [Pseudomonadota bacterium]
MTMSVKTPSAKTPIKQAIKHLHQDIQLSTDAIEQLRQLDCEHNSKPASSQRGFGFRAIAAANIALLGLVAWLLFAYLPGQPENNVNRIVADVVSNHLSHKAMVYDTYSLDELGNKFSHLGFMLSVSRPVEGVEATLIGARPCLILNIPAAQLRYQVNEHRWVTVFQTRYQASIYGPIPKLSEKKNPLVTVKGGVKVSLWQDNGLLFAMAQAD